MLARQYRVNRSSYSDQFGQYVKAVHVLEEFQFQPVAVGVETVVSIQTIETPIIP